MTVTRKNVFISYAREDLEYAEKLYRDLESIGVVCWIDKECLRPGEKWKSAIARAINDSGYFIAVLSRKSVSKRGYVQKELKLALELLDEIPDDEIFLIPIRLEECDPKSDRIFELNWVDFFPSWKEGLSKLSAVLVEEEQYASTERKIPIINDYFKELSERGNRIVINDGVLTISLWNKLLKDVVRYSHMIEPDYIVGVNRGGVMAGAYIALSLGIPSSKFFRCVCTFSDSKDTCEVDIDSASISGKVLILDSVSKSGATIKYIKNELTKNNLVEHVYTAVLVAYHEPGTRCREDIDYYPAESEELDINVPWKNYSNICNSSLDIKSEYLKVNKKSVADIAADLYTEFNK